MTLVSLDAPAVRTDDLAGLPVIVIGAGPVGLAAAARLLERGLEPLVLEAGDDIADSVRAWGHVRLFSPWRLVIDAAAERLLTDAGWTPPPADQLPTGAELVERYLQPLAELPAIADRIRTGARVTAVTRRGMDRTRTAGRDLVPFDVRLADGTSLLARAVLDCSGTFASPNPIASNGLEARRPDGVLPALPDVLGDPQHFAGRRVAVVGAGHSAATTLLDLARLAEEHPATRIVWIIRTDRAARITAADDDGLPARASMGARLSGLVAEGVIDLIDRFEIDVAESAGDGVVLRGRRAGRSAELEADLVVAATGFRPDHRMLREVRLCLDEIVEAPLKLAPLIDPNVHSCGTVPPHGADELRHPEPGFFLAGAKSYGRAPTFLLATGYEQVRSIVAELAGDLESARRVELELPATGVCSTAVSETGSCCD